ncbi:MAG: TonB-dependent receptor [Candidatus Omnitrophica bacterium]|nr:TonB-dependent receptor [Candidatus Omnitrophota bacterium]
MKALRFFAITVLIFGLAICESAFTESRDVYLEKIVVTPYKTGVSGKLNPSSVDVITDEEAENKGATSVTEALRDLTSISYATSGGVAGDTGVFIRGAGSNHTQFLFNGIKLYDPIVTSAYFYGSNYMSLDNIERVEVLKGPYSSLYGSDSIGGTISLISRKGTGEPKFSYLQEAGSYGTFREQLSSDGKIDKLAYSFAASRKDINSFYSAKRKDGNPERDPYHNLNSSIRLDYDINDDVSTGFVGDYTYTKYEYDAASWTTGLPVDDDDNYAHFYQGIAGFNLKQRIGDLFSHKINLGYTRIYRTGWEDNTNDFWYDGNTYQLKWQGDYSVCDWDKIITGFDYIREEGESFWSPSYITPKHSANSKGYYIENIFTPVDNFFLSGSYRIEDHSTFQKHDTFNLAASYNIESTKTKLKSSLGTGFKAPSLYQLFDSASGNRNLSPEESESYEVGFEQKVGTLFTFGSTFFNTRIKNLIEYIGVWPSASYQNSGKAIIYGSEHFAQYTINDTTTLKINFTHMRPLKSDGTPLLRRPKRKLGCSIHSVINKLTVDTGVSYVGSRIDGTSNQFKLSPYVLANLSLEYAINKNWKVFSHLDNILNYDYELIEGYQTPKFSCYVGAKIDF